ncbi:hypothetical protein VNO77_03324 [Canavalia gladiata]|uniref:Uncharacterized protein n=1 Tax=Canavalia gladiata TaxID=3824 RepID=A0AAN9MUJ3_CANGL
MWKPIRLPNPIQAFWRLRKMYLQETTWPQLEIPLVKDHTQQCSTIVLYNLHKVMMHGSKGKKKRVAKASLRIRSLVFVATNFKFYALHRGDSVNGSCSTMFVVVRMKGLMGDSTMVLGLGSFMLRCPLILV